MKLTNLEIKHDQEHQMFFLKLQNSPAYLNYIKPDKNVIDLVETHVPVEFRKKGVASALVEHVLEHAKSERYKVIPSCPFVEDYIRSNPEYKSLIQKEEVDA